MRLLLLQLMILYAIITIESEVIIVSNSKIITYDLCSPGRNYEALYKKLRSYDVWAHICESTWFISTSQTCAEIRDELKTYTDSNDRLFVAELTGTAAWRNVLCESEYLKENL